ncbi:AAA family ATPase [Sporolactobacillus shoreicorticis]|uniref:AAA family ATPase n=1 Tax=Sporolactobacillus shoreicorticis TaxID=1923877 RepID=A0ABW5SB65_9BACL|nr:AAA family ATPase [Sporolactobacillus shoreicorticis]MCO7125978.1 AAA family ATPase [Sporolactobacillus shoreicorticis]
MVNDQAEKLRMRISQEKDTSQTGLIIGVASGKGGVGKSVFCVNFALALGELNKKVLIIDLDVGMGNIEQLIDKNARNNVVNAIKSKLPFQDVQMVVTPNLSFIAGGTGLSSLFHMNQNYLYFFLEQLDQMKRQFDFILLDFGAGASTDMLHFMLAVNRLILITTPEPPAMADSYSLMKMVYALKKDLEISCVVNQIFNRREGIDAWKRLSSVADRFLGTSPTWLASLPRDHDLLMSVRKQIPCMLSRPRARYCIHMRLLARSFLAQCMGQVSHRKTATFTDKVRKYFGLLGRNGR